MGGARRRLGSFLSRGWGWGDKLWDSDDRRWWTTVASLRVWGRRWGDELSIRKRGWGHKLSLKRRG